MRDSRTPFASDADLIRPRKVALGGVSQPKPKLDLKYLWVLGAILVAALLLLALILLAPERREPVEMPATQPPPETLSREQPSNTPTPLEIERQKRALEAANDIVKRFTELEIELEDTWNAATWSEEALGQARAVAVDAEAAFANSEYDQALLGYQQGVVQLEGLLDQAKSEYNQAIGNAVEALDARDAGTASSALARAAVYQPESAMIKAGRRRLERLPELIALLDQATQAESEGAFDEAIRLIEAARAIDAQTNGIASRLTQLRQARFDARFRGILAQGYDALDQGDYTSAENAFSMALGMKPNDPGARQGLEQTRLTRTNLTIETTLIEARRFAQDEHWMSAIDAFERVLEAEPNLNEAVAGVARARSRQSLDTALTNMIADPGGLANERQFSRAQALLQTARDAIPKGAKLGQQIQVLAAQVSRASQPAQLTLVSDSKTDVRLQYHGDLGRFTTHNVETRPGRYLIRGGRDGFREVRFEVDIAPGSQRIEVVCTEPIH